MPAATPRRHVFTLSLIFTISFAFTASRRRYACRHGYAEFFHHFRASPAAELFRPLRAAAAAYTPLFFAAFAVFRYFICRV
jgi:hypothetical protein